MTHRKKSLGYLPHPPLQLQVNASIMPVLAFALKSTKEKGKEEMTDNPC